VLAAAVLFVVPAAIATGVVLAGSESATLEKKIPIGQDATGRSWKLGGFSGLYRSTRPGSRSWHSPIAGRTGT